MRESKGEGGRRLGNFNMFGVCTESVRIYCSHDNNITPPGYIIAGYAPLVGRRST